VEIGPYSPIDFLRDHQVPHAKGNVLQWLRGQPQAFTADFILDVAASDLQLGLELAIKIELRGEDLRRVLARGFDLDPSSIRHWLNRCLLLLGSNGLLGFLEELASADPERVGRVACWLPSAFDKVGLVNYHTISLERLFQRLGIDAPVSRMKNKGW
jgi:hypothetical protein